MYDGILLYFYNEGLVGTENTPLRIAKEEAERANTAKARFLANMSHEIRTPINTIMGMNEMAMREDAAGVPQGYFMSMMNYSFDIRSASESLLSLINNLLDISKIESGNMQLAEREYDTEELLRSVIPLMRLRSTEKILTFDMDIDEMLPCRMYGVGILQIFTYGLSIVNMTMVLVSVCLYIFTYLGINDEVEKTHELEVWNLQKEQQSMQRLFRQTVTAFVAAVEKRDAYSEGHSVRVADYARQIADAAGKSAQECEEVYYAALLHDVGMIALPDSVIQKTEGFTEEELRQQEQKPVVGAEILASITEYPYLSEGARSSHERYDGKGYPAGLKGDEIPEISRIIAVADAYDTMITGKRSHAPLSYQVVREEFIKQAGAQFDPVYSEIMVQIMDAEHRAQKQADAASLETELTCGTYRETVSAGIQVDCRAENRRTAWRRICLHLFRHLAQKILAGRQPSGVISIQSDEKSDGSNIFDRKHPAPPALCGIAISFLGDYQNHAVSFHEMESRYLDSGWIVSLWRESRGEEHPARSAKREILCIKSASVTRKEKADDLTNGNRLSD